MKVEEFDDYLHTLPIEDVIRLETAVRRYLGMWWGITNPHTRHPNAEWVEKARWRVEGLSEPCCRCGEDYPRFDHQFLGHYYCEKCRQRVKS